jgi:DNA-binding NtrC family response regulator
VNRTRPDTQTGNHVSKPRRGDAPYLFIALQCERPLESAARICLHRADEVTVGRGSPLAVRAEGSTLRVDVPDGRISARHLRISRVLGQWVLEDLQSRNGTLIDGSRIERTGLSDGTLIEAGQTFFIFRTALPQAGNVLEADALEVAAPGLETLLPTFAAELERVRTVARSRLPVLLQGETGTGKEVIASAIHRLSGRTGPFLAVNCGALPMTLVESEMFGYRKGAFTGAMEDRPGLIRSAEGGTLLLDEIGDLPLPAQATLLRVLQEEEVMPVGGTRPTKVDLRVIAATHRDLPALVAHDKFRHDLLMRLCGFTVNLPPLRERREDFGLLLSRLLRRNEGGAKITFTPEAGRAMLRYGWPGNVRELEKCLSSAAVLAQDGVVELEHLPASIAAAPAAPVAIPAGHLSADERERRELIISLLREHGGNVTSVAKAMGKARTQVQRWLRRYDIDPLAYRR